MVRRATLATLAPVPGPLERLALRFAPQRARELTLPDFLGIGAEKAATTWLYANLQQHPEVFLPGRKELHYFDLHFDRPLGDYAASFAEAKPGQVKGEITPAYGHLPARRIRFMRRVMPDVRLILLLRDPVERAWSHAVMDLADRKGRSIGEVPDEEILAFVTSDASIRRGAYATMIDRWLSSFPRDQLFIGFFEDVAKWPRRVLVDIFEHLGVSTEVDLDAFPTGERILPNLDKEVAPGDWVRVAPLESLRAQRPPCPAGVRERLEKLYERDIEVVSALIGGPALRWRRGEEGRAASEQGGDR